VGGRAVARPNARRHPSLCPKQAVVPMAVCGTGLGHCVDPESEVSAIRLHVAAGFGQTSRQPHNTDNGTVVMPSRWSPVVRQRQLYLYGRWPTTPPGDLRAGPYCQLPMLHNATRYCTADQQLCRDYASMASCTLPALLDLYGSRMPVVITVGRGQRVIHSWIWR
jgi:hypothetical protein